MPSTRTAKPLLALLPLLIGACTSFGVTMSEVKANDITYTIARLKPVDGKWDRDGSTGTFTAYFNGDHIIYVRDARTVADGDTVSGEYFYENDRLFLAREGRRVHVGGGRYVRKNLTVTWSEDGDLQGAKELIDGEEQEPAAKAVDATRRHANELAAAAVRVRDGAAVAR
ncbi:MAG: hypothetical protein KIT14_01070 [bacterium]|nr:hypothetical protein [bacterium]